MCSTVKLNTKNKFFSQILVDTPDIPWPTLVHLSNWRTRVYTIAQAWEIHSNAWYALTICYWKSAVPVNLLEKDPWIGLVVEEWQCKLLGPYWGLLWKFHSSYSWRHVKTNHRLTTTTNTAIQPDWLNHSKPIPRAKELKHCPLSLIALDCICCRRLEMQAEFMFFERRTLWFIWEHCI